MRREAETTKTAPAEDRDARPDGWLLLGGASPEYTTKKDMAEAYRRKGYEVRAFFYKRPSAPPLDAAREALEAARDLLYLDTDPPSVVSIEGEDDANRVAQVYEQISRALQVPEWPDHKLDTLDVEVLERQRKRLDDFLRRLDRRGSSILGRGKRERRPHDDAARAHFQQSLKRNYSRDPHPHCREPRAVLNIRAFEELPPEFSGEIFAAAYPHLTIHVLAAEPGKDFNDQWREQIERAAA
jgi:hypothetical protein